MAQGLGTALGKAVRKCCMVSLALTALGVEKAGVGVVG